MSDEEIGTFETPFELNDIKNERWQDDVSLRSSVGHMRYARKPSRPRYRAGTRDVIFDPVTPGDILTNAINMRDSTEVMYRDWAEDPCFLDRNLPLLDEAYGVQGRDFIIRQNINLTLATHSINHHIAGNAFAAMAHNRRRAMIARGLHEMNLQQLRERVFLNVVGSVTAPASTATAGDAAVASFTLGSPVDHPLDERTGELHPSENPMASADSLRSLSHSSRPSSASTLNSAKSDESASQCPQGPSDIPPAVIHNASPVSLAANGYSQPHIRLRQLTRLSLLADLDEASNENEIQMAGDPGSQRPASPLSIRQRQEIVRARLASNLGQVDDGAAAGPEADIGATTKSSKKSWWSRLMACFGCRREV
ncbi:hypothetical protein GP486_002063 [Trichoglossum hirsutum]|uniref:Uncharacterized protein n=1 Tax=Trichoglossum hirsutum TaxID=265104 RepID=A0A9P8LFT1_9PEZI|nr:hypothetical protein GP486_002063 [Trichoglossum hirsutum]